MLADFRIRCFAEPVHLPIANLEHASDSNSPVLKLSIEFAEDMAGEESIRAPGEDDHQERERQSLLERQPESQAT